MSQLILESENEHNLKLIQELAEKLNIHCQLILQKTKSAQTKSDDLTNAMQFIKNFTQTTTSFGDALEWQQAQRQERSLD